MADFSIFYHKLREKKLDGFLVSSASNLFYFTHFSNPDAYGLFSLKGNSYLTDPRYKEQSQAKLGKEFSLIITDGSIFSALARECFRLGLKRIGFEERHLPFAEYQKLKELLKKKVNLVPAFGLIEELRKIKNEEELAKIKKAAAITLKALKFIKDFLREGVKEIEVAAELERIIRYLGAEEAAFKIIVAFGKNSSFPHHIPTLKKLSSDDLILIDLGVSFQGYKSDLTRIFFLDKIRILYRKIYDLVLKAQEIAFKKIKSGEKTSAVDLAARNYLASKKYGENFIHGIGHGVGIDVHEEPFLNARNQQVLQEGMVFTVEPAIYLPGQFGIRIEDMVLVTKKGCEILSN